MCVTSLRKFSEGQNVTDSNNKDGLMHFHGLFTENTRNVRFKVPVQIPDGNIQQNNLYPTALSVSRNYFAFNFCMTCFVPLLPIK